MAWDELQRPNDDRLPHNCEPTWNGSECAASNSSDCAHVSIVPGRCGWMHYIILYLTRSLRISINVVKTMSCLPSPSHQHFYRWYGNPIPTHGWFTHIYIYIIVLTTLYAISMDFPYVKPPEALKKVCCVSGIGVQGVPGVQAPCSAAGMYWHPGLGWTTVAAMEMEVYSWEN